MLKNIKGLLFDPGLPVKSVLFPASSSGRRTFGPRKRARGGMFGAAPGHGSRKRSMPEVERKAPPPA